MAMLLMGLLLLMASTSLVGMLGQSKSFGARAQAYALAHNLMETLLSLPETKAKALDIEDNEDWTAHHRFEAKATWEPPSDPKQPFEKLTVEYLQHGNSLIKLVTLTPHSS